MSVCVQVAEFKAKCGVDVGTSVARRPGVDEIDAMVRSWLGMPGRKPTGPK